MSGKIILSVVVCVLVVSSGLAAEGEDEVARLKEQIARLLAQVQSMQQQMVSLQGKLDNLELEAEPEAEVDEASDPQAYTTDVEQLLLAQDFDSSQDLPGIDLPRVGTRLGAWVDFVYKDTSKLGSRHFLDPHHLYLYFDHRLGDRWQAFAEVEFEHAPKADGGGTSGEIKLERSYIQYAHNDAMKFRFGRFATRSGIWTPEHWAVTVDSTQKPIHEDNAYVPRRSVGVEFSGSRFATDNTEFNYAAFLSNGAEDHGTDNPMDNDLGFGFDFNARFGSGHLLGISPYFQNNPHPRLGGTPGRNERNLMFYGETKFHNLLLRSEYLRQWRSDGDPNVDVLYAKVKWQMHEQWYLNYRWNKGVDERRASGDKQTVNTLTLAFWPRPNIRLRLEYNLHDFRDQSLEDHKSWSAYLGYIFF